MTSIGRGRGWANIEDREAVLRRPGKVALSKDIKFNDLINEIDNLDLTKSNPLEKVDDIVLHIKGAVSNKSLKDVYDVLHTQALEDKQFGTKLAALLGDQKIYSFTSNDGEVLRNLCLSTLQSDYTRRKELKDQSATKFFNTVSLLGELFFRMRIRDKPIKVIASPLLDCMNMLLESASEEDIELVTTLIAINGRNIYESNQAELEKFLMYVRSVLVNRNLSARSRAMLLLIVDLGNQRYSPISGELQAFYLTQLGSATMVQLQRHDDQEDLTVITKSKDQFDVGGSEQECDSKEGTNLNTTGESNAGILMRVPKPGKSVKNDTFDQRNYAWNVGHATNSVISGIPVPRAIRGSGVGNSGKDYKSDKKSYWGKKDNLVNEQASSSKHDKADKRWEHDDRFDKHYE